MKCNKTLTKKLQKKVRFSGDKKKEKEKKNERR